MEYNFVWKYCFFFFSYLKFLIFFIGFFGSMRMKFCILFTNVFESLNIQKFITIPVTIYRGILTVNIILASIL